MFNSVRLIIDDTNSTLLYAGAWFTAGNGSPAFNSTTHGTKAPRSTTTFKFNGTRQAISKINAVAESTSDRAARAGAIAAGVIAVIAILAALVLAFLLIRRGRSTDSVPDLLGNFTGPVTFPSPSEEVEQPKSGSELLNGVPIICEPRPPPLVRQVVRTPPPTIPEVDQSIGAVPLRTSRRGTLVNTESAASSRSSNLRTLGISLPNPFGGAGPRQPPTGQLRPGVHLPFPVKPRHPRRFVVANGSGTPSNLRESIIEGSNMTNPVSRNHEADYPSRGSAADLALQSSVVDPATHDSADNPESRRSLALDNLTLRILIQKHLSRSNTLSHSLLIPHAGADQCRPRSQTQLPPVLRLPFPVRTNHPNPHGGGEAPYEVTEMEMAH